MKTRFDGNMWIGAGGTAFMPSEMDTDHLLNTLKMLKNRPAVVVTMVVRDIESAPPIVAPLIPSETVMVSW